MYIVLYVGVDWSVHNTYALLVRRRIGYRIIAEELK